MQNLDTSDRLIGLAYEASLDPDCWPVLLDGLRKHLHADSGLLRLYDDRCTELNLNLTVGFDPAYQRLYRERFVQDDPVRDRVAELPPGRMRRGDEVIPFSSLRRTPFYNEYMRPQGKRHLLGGPLLRESGLVAIFGVQRRGRRGAFIREQSRWLAWMAGHLQRALRLYLHGARLDSRCRALSSLLDASPTAVFGIDGSGQVLLMNAPAEQLISGDSPLYLRDGRLHSHDRHGERELQRQIADTLVAAAEGAVGRPYAGTVCADRSPSDIPTGVLTIPWTDPIHNDVGSARQLRALVLIGPSQLEHAGAADVVATLLQLTRAEARLVVALVECGTLEAAAERSGIRIGTARDYIKSALQKTGCRRQGELIRTVLCTPAAQFSGIGGSR